MNILIHKIVWMGVGAALLLGPREISGQEQPLTLEQARSLAARGAGDVRSARARLRAAEAERIGSDAFLWPSVTAEAGAIRSNDPVAAFGGRLRQGAFAEADFDPARLNDPGPLTDWSGALGISWAPWDAAGWSGRSAAALQAEAAGRGAEWAERAAVFRTEALYLGAVGADALRVAADVAVAAAEASLRRVDLRVEEGVSTDADVWRARAALEAARARAIDAARRVADARARLGVSLGWDPSKIPVPTDTVFPEGLPRGPEPTGRADLEASELATRAVEERALEAGRRRLPSARAFARLETHAADPFSGIRSDWTAGFVVGIPIFTGRAATSGQRAAQAAAEAARTEHEERVRAARAEVAEAERALDTARRAREAADAGRRAAEEAARLVRLRFEEGLVTTADLLTAESASAEMAAASVSARIDLALAYARLAFLTEPALGALDR